MKEMSTMQGVVTHDSHVFMQISGKAITTRLCNERMGLTMMMLLHWW